MPSTPKSISSQYSPSPYSPCPNSVQPTTSNLCDQSETNDSIQHAFTPSQAQANEFIRALANNNYEINEYSSASNFRMTPMNHMRGASGSESNDMAHMQRYNWMS